MARLQSKDGGATAGYRATAASGDTGKIELEFFEVSFTQTHGTLKEINFALPVGSGRAFVN